MRNRAIIRRLLALIALYFSSAVATAETQELPTSALAIDDAQYYRYDNGRIVEQRAVHRGDPMFDRLLALLGAHDSGWTVLSMHVYVRAYNIGRQVKRFPEPPAFPKAFQPHGSLLSPPDPLVRHQVIGEGASRHLPPVLRSMDRQ